MSKSLRMLTHPLALLAILLVALNDFLLKPLAPSWLTGKLSDLGMLVFLPLLLAGLLELALPRWGAAALSFGIVAGAFVLLKAGPVTAGWLGFLPLRSIADPTDLLALPALAGAFWLWRRGESAPASPLRWRLLALPLAAVTALADSAMPDMGVTCLAEKDGSFYAQAGFGRVYASRDGGLTWQVEGDSWQDRGECWKLQNAGPLVLSAPGGGAEFRVTSGGPVERSADGGATWQAVGAFAPLSEPEEAYLRKTRANNVFVQAAPVDALIDPATGSLLLAMGLEGVAIVRPDGSLQWAAVGDNAHDTLRASAPGSYFTLLAGELVLALLGGLIWLASGVLAGTRRAWTVVSVLAWLSLAGSALALFPELANGPYTGIFPAAGLAVTGLLTLALLAGAAARLRLKLLNHLPLALLLSVLAAAPYVLWGLGVLPVYGYALAIAIVVVIAAGILMRGKGETRL